MRSKTFALGVVVVLIVGAIVYLQSQKSAVSPSEASRDAEIVVPSLTDAEKAQRYDRARELVDIAGYINTDSGFTLADNIGEKVILLDIWTYSCINCQRTLPYITQWHTQYEDDGLLIVGVHTPEFEFEKDRDNVLRATEKFGIDYPVVLDNNYGTWHAYNNRYWPRKYLIDIEGYVVYDHIGEGAYAETEQKIRELLAERAEQLDVPLSFNDEMPMVTEESDDDAGISALLPRSPEVYFGAFRNQLLANGDPGMQGGFQLKANADDVESNMLYLDGAWNIYREYAQNARADARIIFRYQGDKVFMVASAPEGATIRLLRDGEPIGDAAGADVDENGRVRITDEQLYHLVDNPDGHGEHTLEIIIEDAGLEAYTFTFG